MTVQSSGQAGNPWMIGYFTKHSLLYKNVIQEEREIFEASISSFHSQSPLYKSVKHNHLLHLVPLCLEDMMPHKQIFLKEQFLRRVKHYFSSWVCTAETLWEGYTLS